MKRDSAERAISWLLESGIYVLDKNDRNYGAAYSHYHCLRKKFELVYAEATGYLVSLLIYLNSKDEDANLVDLARASGNWLVRLAEKYGGTIVVGLDGNSEIREAFAFDNGVCCKAMLDLYGLTGDEQYLACAERIANWLVSRVSCGDGSFKPAFDVDSGDFIEDKRVYYKASGSFHAKIAMPLFQLYTLTENRETLDAAMRVCSWAIAQQKPDGGFPVNRYEDAVKLHFHCYTVEALLYAYASRNSEQFLQSAKRAVNWLLGQEKANGSFETWSGRGIVRITSSYVPAQAIRIFLLLHKLTREERLIGAAERAARNLVEWQASCPDRRINGGFLGSKSTGWNRFLARDDPRVSSWCTMFAIQALDLWERRDSMSFDDTIKGLF